MCNKSECCKYCERLFCKNREKSMYVEVDTKDPNKIKISISSKNCSKKEARAFFERAVNDIVNRQHN